MLFGKKKGLAIETLLGARTRLEGELRFSGGLRIDGQIKGNVIGDPDKPSMLVVTDSARIEGEVHVGHLILNGTVVGPVHVSELLELQPKARSRGQCAVRGAGNAPGCRRDGYADAFGAR